MILVIGGTTEGRTIARALAEKGARVLVSTATAHGAALAGAGGAPEAVHGRLDSRGLEDLIAARSIKVVVDASHPYALEVSRNASTACGRAGIGYIRYARPGGSIPDSPLLREAGDFEAAAVMACDLGNTIFLATGSKTAGIFYRAARERGRRVVVRVIPDPEAIRGLLDMGFGPADVVAVHGPFGREINEALWRHFGADVAVTKESGREGGLAEKIAAAAGMGIPLVVVKRPPEPPEAVRSAEGAVREALHYINK